MTGSQAPWRPEPRALAVQVWAVAFGYAAAAALLFQLVILPHLLPTWHAGDGLLVGGDWLTFHDDAVKIARRVRTEGWSTFELRPHGQAPAGIAAAIYALTWPKPWALIPLNAALHATAAALLFHLLRGFVGDRRWAAIGTAPFVFYPTTLTWVAQIHKDGFFIAGYLSLFVAWVDLARLERVVGQWSALARALLLLVAGFGLIWLVRPDLAMMAYAAAGIALGVLVVQTAARIWRDPGKWRRGAVMLACALLTTLASAWLTSVPGRFVEAQEAAGQRARDLAALGRLSPVRIGDGVSTWVDPTGKVVAIPWYRSAWLPAPVDELAYRLALTREAFIVYYIENQSNVDVDVGFYRASDMLRYLPRALEVALLAPFPTRWGETGSLAWTTVGRRVVAVEMLGVYVALLPLPLVLWRWRRRADLWIVVLPCLAILGVYSLVVSNLGALHRFRYGFLMVLVGLGLAAGLDLLSRALATLRVRASVRAP